jgi:hypothetical protein
MPLLSKEKISPRRLRDTLGPTLCALLMFLLSGREAPAQEPVREHGPVVTPLAELLEEAEKNNPRIEATRQGWQAATHDPCDLQLRASSA